MRADRLLSILLLLQVHRRLTAGELARRLEVSERTIHRDMEALSAAGVPLYAQRGTGGGWVLPEEFRTSPTGLNEAEVRALFLPGPSRLLADLGLDKAADAALVKLLGALPVMHRRNADYVRQRIHIDVGGWRRSEEETPLLPVVQEAVWCEQKLRLTYGREESDATERVVDPLGLVAKGSVWYLVAGVEGELRTYRVSRVRSAALSEEPCDRPADFDLPSYWDASMTSFVERLPRYNALFRVRADFLPRLHYGGWFARIERTDPVDADGWANVAVRFQFEEEACGYALGQGMELEVIEPPELREKVAAMALGIAERYAQGGNEFPAGVELGLKPHAQSRKDAAWE